MESRTSETELSNLIALEKNTAFPVSVTLGVSVMPGWSVIVIEMVNPKVIVPSI